MNSFLESSRRRTGPFPRSIAILAVMALGLTTFFISKSVFSTLAQKAEPDGKLLTKVEFRNSRVREPIEIVQILSNGKGIETNVAFQDTEWLKELTIRFKNVSEKTITHVDLNLLFPETAEGEPPKSYSLTYGLHFSKQKQGAVGMKYLQPGDTDEVSLSSTGYSKLKNLVGLTKDLNQLSRADLSLQVVYFDDGTQWSAGEMFRQDPTNPKRFIPILAN